MEWNTEDVRVPHCPRVFPALGPLISRGGSGCTLWYIPLTKTCFDSRPPLLGDENQPQMNSAVTFGNSSETCPCWVDCFPQDFLWCNAPVYLQVLWGPCLSHWACGQHSTNSCWRSVACVMAFTTMNIISNPPIWPSSPLQLLSFLFEEERLKTWIHTEVSPPQGSTLLVSQSGVPVHTYHTYLYRTVYATMYTADMYRGMGVLWPCYVHLP